MDENEFMRMFGSAADEDLAAGLALVPQRIRDALPRTEECSHNVHRVNSRAKRSARRSHRRIPLRCYGDFTPNIRGLGAVWTATEA